GQIKRPFPLQSWRVVARLSCRNFYQFTKLSISKLIICSEMEEINGKTFKKPFNKRAHFRHKYKKNFGSQQEGHGKALLQKKEVMQQYFKEKKFERKKGTWQTPYQSISRADEPEQDRFSLLSNAISGVSEESSKECSSKTYRKHNPSSLKRAKGHRQNKIAERAKYRELREQRYKDIEAAALRRKEERLKRNKKLSQFTKKGQPVMRGRIELMLEKLEREIN
ncbi:hypothetical protein SK128_020376, partial [Halocaridina rubra]